MTSKRLNSAYPLPPPAALPPTNSAQSAPSLSQMKSSAKVKSKTAAALRLTGWVTGGRGGVWTGWGYGLMPLMRLCHLLQFKRKGRKKKCKPRAAVKMGKTNRKRKCKTKAQSAKLQRRRQTNWSRSSAQRGWGWGGGRWWPNGRRRQRQRRISGHVAVQRTGVQPAPVPGGCTLLGHRPLNWIGCGSVAATQQRRKRSRGSGGGTGEEYTKSTEPSSRRHFGGKGGQGGCRLGRRHLAWRDAKWKTWRWRGWNAAFYFYCNWLLPVLPVCVCVCVYVTWEGSRWSDCIAGKCALSVDNKATWARTATAAAAQIKTREMLS